MTGCLHRTVGTSLLRIGAAAAVVHFHLSSYGDRHVLWGPDGPLAGDHRLTAVNPLGRFTPYDLLSGPEGFDIIFHTGMILAVAFALCGGRGLAALNWLFLQSLHARNPLVLDGGDNLLRILLLFLLLTENNLHFAVGAGRRRARWQRRLVRPTPSLRAMFHNSGVALIVFQVLALYGSAVLWKLAGEEWRDGTALYYVARAAEFSYRPLPAFVVDNPFLVTLVTYSIIASQIAIVVLGVTRRHPALLLGTAVAIHGGIAISMGLITFSVVILSVDSVLVGDGVWVRWLHGLRRWIAPRTLAAVAGESVRSAGHGTAYQERMGWSIDSPSSSTAPSRAAHVPAPP